jgi:hypothetical protein
MENEIRHIKLIWDFRGQDGHQTALHHEIHLKQFAEKENIEVVETGVDKENSLFSSAFIIVKEPQMKIVRDALIPHRGEVSE